MTKIIQNFTLDLSNLASKGEVRKFNILGDRGSEFILQITNEDSSYYNFTTQKFQSQRTNLEAKVIGSSYSGYISFPKVGDDDYYEIYLYAKPGTKHTDYNEVRFIDNSFDINSSTGSDSLLLRKIIYQYTDITLTISPFTLGGTIEVGSVVSDTVIASRGKSSPKTSFSISCAVTTATKSYRILKQPSEFDIFAYVLPTVGSSPVKIDNEDIYPAIANTDTVNGAVSNSNEITMDTAVASKMSVGDKVTGFTSEEDHAQPVTVTSLASTYVFNTSENISAGDGVTLSFSPQKNYRWPVNNYVNKIKSGMFATTTAGTTTIGDYIDTTIINSGLDTEEEVINIKIEASDTAGNAPVVSEGLITTQAGNIVFVDTQPLSIASTTIKIGGTGESEILRIFGYDIKFTDLKIEFTAITTTTTAAVNNSATVPIASVLGILPNISTVSGLGIDSSVANPTVSARSATSGAGNLTLSAVQTLESGRTLTFANAGQTATITGKIEILKTGTENQTLRFNVDNLLSIT